MLCNLPCRIVLIVINSVTGLLGLVLLAVGALMVWGKDVFVRILDQFLTPLLRATGVTTDAAQITELVSRISTSTAPIGMALFSIGAAFAILSFVGYCGACCNYKILLYIYAALIGILALVVLVAFSVYFSLRDRLADMAVDLFEKSVRGYVSMKANTVDSLVVGLLQPALKCCGVTGRSDFSRLSTTDNYGGVEFNNVICPIPCCKMSSAYVLEDDQCPSNPTVNNSYIDVACRKPLKELFIHYMNYAAYGLIGAFIILLLLMLFTILTVCIDIV